MNVLEPIRDSTSAAGAMRSRDVRELTFVGCVLAGRGTSTTYAPIPDAILPWQDPLERTTAGVALSVPASSHAAISELRKRSGLTWEQLARLFNVSRRALHFWASGKPMASGNEEQLQRLLAFVRTIDRGSASATRAVLLGVCQDGSVPLDLLAAGEYGLALSLIGRGDGRKPPLPKLSDEARAARAPRPPEELVGALQDRIQGTGERLLRASPISVVRRK